MPTVEEQIGTLNAAVAGLASAVGVSQTTMNANVAAAAASATLASTKADEASTSADDASAAQTAAAGSATTASTAAAAAGASETNAAASAGAASTASATAVAADTSIQSRFASAQGFSGLAGSLLDLWFGRQVYSRREVPTSFASVLAMARNSLADCFGPQNVTLLPQAAVNAARIDGRGFLSEELTAYVANNSALTGLVAGTPGTTPTNWVAGAASGGLSRQVVGTEMRNGALGMLLRYSGTPNTTSTLVFQFGGANARTAGDTVSHGILIALAAGSLTNLTGFQLRSGSETVTTAFTPTATPQWVTNTRVLTGTDGSLRVRFNCTDTVTPVDFTLWVALPTTVNGPYLLSPAITGTSSFTRLGDVLTSVLSSLPLPDTTWTIAGLARMPSTPANAVERLLNLSVDANNRIGLRRETGGLLSLEAIVAGAATGAATVTAPAAGARFAFCIRRNGSEIAICIDGGTVIKATPSSLPGIMTALNIGSAVSGAGQWNARIERMAVFGTAISDGAMQSTASVSYLSTTGA